MSLTCHEEIGRVGRAGGVGRGCYEDASDFIRPSRHVKMVWRVADMSVTSRACRIRGIWRTTRQTDKLNGEVASILLVASS